MDEYELERQLYLLGEMKRFLPESRFDPFASSTEDDELDLPELSLVSAAGAAPAYRRFLVIAKADRHE